MQILKKCLPLIGFLMLFGSAPIWAQEETPEEKAYREDYEQYQTILAEKDVTKRTDALLKFIQERPQSKLSTNAQTDCLYILDGLAKAEKWDTLVLQSERLVKLKPRVGETYYYLGLGLNGQKKFDEAMSALAKCNILNNPGSARAKTFLEMLWKGRHQGKLDGLTEFIAKIKKEMGA
jgi:tetratricopeptide (TPR) repeat protein